MTKREVFETLKTHFERTGKLMTSEELILASGQADPKNLIAGRRLFNKYMDLQRGGAA
ncbi:hypothetical protein [Domibacillus antri]|uniref:hypothetical protein n=1 Tax=Domibacillus antri TaxID=1714264 RepID=UPI000B31B376|nr:hypothetical protein [Domibacillus antri]